SIGTGIVGQPRSHVKHLSAQADGENAGSPSGRRAGVCGGDGVSHPRMTLTGVSAVRLAPPELYVGPPLQTLGLRILLVLLFLRPTVGRGSAPSPSTPLPRQLDFPAALR